MLLGSFPSIQSRENNFYYANPYNRFWKVLETIFNTPIGDTPLEKTNFLLAHNIALWDVVKSCTIIGSSDSSIKDISPNDISELISHSKIDKIYTIGKTATKLYQKYIYPTTHIKSIYLSSTSSANATKKLEDLVEEYRKNINTNSFQ